MNKIQLNNKIAKVSDRKTKAKTEKIYDIDSIDSNYITIRLKDVDEK